MSALNVLLYCHECGRSATECYDDNDDTHNVEAYIPLRYLSETELERLRAETLEVNTVDGLKKLPPKEEVIEGEAVELPPKEEVIEGEAVELPQDRFDAVVPPPTETVDGEEIDPELKELMEEEGGFGQ